jgi:lipopolysaccharide transport system permease protein
MGIAANNVSTLKSTKDANSIQAESTDSVSASHPTLELPSQPIVTIQPSGTWGVLNLRESLRDIWNYRELLYFLIWRDVKVRYKQTALGVAWAIIQPLFTMLIFSLFFGRLAGVPSDNIPYPLFAYAGLLPWTFFANAIGNSGNSLVGSANLITKVYFPRLIVPAAAIGAGLVDLGISFVVLIPLMIYYGVTLSWSLLMLPVFVVLTALLALGVGMWSSALNVKYRDVRFALPFLIQLWMFVSPVIYPTSFLPERWRVLFALNPMTGIIEGYRSALFARSFNWKALAISTLITLAVLVYASVTFRRMEKSFADIV